MLIEAQHLIGLGHHEMQVVGHHQDGEPLFFS